jgi:hypothetical protein
MAIRRRQSNGKECRLIVRRYYIIKLYIEVPHAARYRSRKRAASGGPYLADSPGKVIRRLLRDRLRLLYDFNDPMCPGVDEDCTIVDNCVAVIAHAIFRGNIVISHPRVRQFGPYSHVPTIGIRRSMLLDDIMLEAWALIYAEQAGHPTDDPANGSANNRPNWTSCPVTIAGAAFYAAGDALSRNMDWHE